MQVSNHLAAPNPAALDDSPFGPIWTIIFENVTPESVHITAPNAVRVFWPDRFSTVTVWSIVANADINVVAARNASIARMHWRIMNGFIRATNHFRATFATNHSVRRAIAINIFVRGIRIKSRTLMNRASARIFIRTSSTSNRISRMCTELTKFLWLIYHKFAFFYLSAVNQVLSDASANNINIKW